MRWKETHTHRNHVKCFGWTPFCQMDGLTLKGKAKKNCSFFSHLTLHIWQVESNRRCQILKTKLRHVNGKHGEERLQKHANTLYSTQTLLCSYTGASDSILGNGSISVTLPTHPCVEYQLIIWHAHTRTVHRHRAELLLLCINISTEEESSDCTVIDTWVCLKGRGFSPSGPQKCPRTSRTPEAEPIPNSLHMSCYITWFHSFSHSFCGRNGIRTCLQNVWNVTENPPKLSGKRQINERMFDRREKKNVIFLHLYEDVVVIFAAPQLQWCPESHRFLSIWRL